jgi:hypothetical protein
MNEKNEEIKNRPVRKWHIGAVHVAEWINTNKDTKQDFSVFSLEVNYPDKQSGQFKSAIKTNSAISEQLMRNLYVCLGKVVNDIVKFEGDKNDS